MTDTVEVLQQEIQEAAANDATLSSLGSLVGIRPLEVNKRSFSTVRRFALAFEERELDVCLKIHRRSNRGFEQECVAWANEEYCVLKSLHTRAGDGSELSVVRPILFLPKLPGILMETHAGEILNDRLRRVRFGKNSESWEELGRCFYDVGRNLKEMQRLSTEDPEVRGAFSLVRWVLDAEYVTDEADRGSASAVSFLKSSRRSAAERAYAESRAQFLATLREGYPTVAVHGDFTPVNVFARGERVTLFDFVNVHHGHPYEDVSRFLCYTYFLQKDPLSYGVSRVHRLMVDFMSGYGLEGWRDDAALRFFFQKNMFRTLGGGLRFQARRWPMRSLYRYLMLRVYRRWVDDGMGLNVIAAGVPARTERIGL